MDQLEKKAGVHKQIFSPRGQRYTISIPKGYTGQVAVPFILALHYRGNGTPFFGNGILSGLVEPGLHKLGAIIVAPDCLHGDWANQESEAGSPGRMGFHQYPGFLGVERSLIWGSGINSGGIARKCVEFVRNFLYNIYVSSTFGCFIHPYDMVARAILEER